MTKEEVNEKVFEYVDKRRELSLIFDPLILSRQVLDDNDYEGDELMRVFYARRIKVSVEDLLIWAQDYYDDHTPIYSNNDVEKYGLMTDEMVRLAEVLGLREGKHTANSVARIARERIEELLKKA